jgi:hypothetical protein
MKKFFVPAALTLALLPSIAFGDTNRLDSLVKTGELYYKKITDVPFTGKTTGKIQGSFQNGKNMAPGSFTTKMGNYISKNPTRTARNTVFG